MTSLFFSTGAFLITLVTIGQWIRAIKNVAVPTNRTAYFIALVIAAGLGIAAFATGTGWIGGISSGLAIFVALFFFFTHFIGPQRAEATAIKVGDALPAFTAVDEQGQTFDTSSLAGHPVLIKFFRGHW